jgi:hypothetical protein
LKTQEQVNSFLTATDPTGRVEPVYTHPADLTDEEILKMAADRFHYSEYRLVIDFARAILRKAQEK